MSFRSNPKDSVILTALRLPRPGERWLLDPVPAEGQLLPPLLDIGNVSRGQLSTWLREKLTLAGERGWSLQRLIVCCPPGVSGGPGVSVGQWQQSV